MAKQLLNLTHGFNMSDDMFAGVFDADGSVLIQIDSHVDSNTSKSPNNEKTKQPFGIRVSYEFAQSNSKRDLVEKVATKFGSIPRNTTDNTVFRVGATSVIGKQIRDLLLNNKPLYPGRLRDFLLSEEILTLNSQKVQKTKKGLVTLIHLAYNNSYNLKNSKRKKDLQYWINQINPSKDEFAAGQAEARAIVRVVEQQVSALESVLVNKTLSLDYVRGAHYGDGGLTVSLTWKPNKDNRLRTEPEWTISGENKAYCTAFVNTFNKGTVNKSGPNCHKYKLSGIAACKETLSIFKNTWMPLYKQQQLATFEQALDLLKAKRHLTKQGGTELVNLVYDMSEKGHREYSKQQYIDWAHNWLDKKGYK